MPATDWLRDDLINTKLRGVASTTPAAAANWYVTLLQDDPTRAGLLTSEFSGGSFARVAISVATGSWDAPSTAGDGRRTANTGAITFPAPTADWGTASYGALMDGSTLGAGNMGFYWELGAPRTILGGDNPPSFAIGTQTIDFV